MRDLVPVHAILLDIGGPIVDERPDYLHSMEIVIDLLRSEAGIDVTREDIESIMDTAIRAYTPSVTKAVIWHFIQPDINRAKEVYREAIRRIFTRRSDVVLMEGIDDVIPAIASKYKLALAGNQPKLMREKLERTGLMSYFESDVISDEIGLHKPDSRFFLEICNRIGEMPENCVMVGDRLDNDVYPANVLGMRTVWLRVGTHAAQKPRVPEDVPDATIEDIRELVTVLGNWEREIKGN